MSYYGSIVRSGVQFYKLLLAEVQLAQCCSVASAINQMPDCARYHSRGMASGSPVLVYTCFHYLLLTNWITGQSYMSYMSCSDSIQCNVTGLAFHCLDEKYASLFHLLLIIVYTVCHRLSMMMYAANVCVLRFHKRI